VARAEGVSCAACHVRDGVVVGARSVPVSTGAHDVRAVAGFDGPELCAGCHQFNFPEATGDLEAPDGRRSAVHYSDQSMQDTIAEARAAGAGACSTCHSGGHRWTASDPAWLAQQFGEGHLDPDSGVVSLRVEVAPRGHALPTGDPFRTLHLEVALDAAFERVWFRSRYGREFDGRLGADGTFIKGGQSRDTRIPAGRAAITTTFDRPPASRIFARLRLFLHDRWVSGKWTPDPATAKVVWSQTFELEPDLP
jgi:hypothetical protein